MKVGIHIPRVRGRLSCKPVIKHLAGMVGCLALLIWTSGTVQAQTTEWPRPVITINGDLWPIDYEANRRQMFSFDAMVLKKADHFLMMDCPKEFNRALEKAIHMILGKSGQ